GMIRLIKFFDDDFN
ncbi:hypothetical protein EC880221_2149, partial [Escherichia coli 88.0221]